MVKSYSHDTSSEKDPLCLIVNGVAGTGKSYLIKGIRNVLQSKCAVTAITGKAAYNIRGITVNSLLLITSSLMNTPCLAKLLLVGLTSVANKQQVVMTKYFEKNLSF